MLLFEAACAAQLTLQRALPNREAQSRLRPALPGRVSATTRPARPAQLLTPWCTSNKILPRFPPAGCPGPGTRWEGAVRLMRDRSPHPQTPKSKRMIDAREAKQCLRVLRQLERTGILTLLALQEFDGNGLSLRLVALRACGCLISRLDLTTFMLWLPSANVHLSDKVQPDSSLGTVQS